MRITGFPAYKCMFCASPILDLHDRSAVLAVVTHISTRFTKGEKTPAGKVVTPPSRSNLDSSTTTSGRSEHEGPLPPTYPRSMPCRRAERRLGCTVCLSVLNIIAYVDSEWQHTFVLEDELSKPYSNKLGSIALYHDNRSDASMAHLASDTK